MMCDYEIYFRESTSEQSKSIPNVNFHLSSSKYYVKSKFDMNHVKCYIIMCLKNVFGRVRVSEANEHPNVNIHFSSSKSYRKGEFDMNRAKYYTNMCLD